MIVKMEKKHLKNFKPINETFWIIGKLVPKYENDIWSFKEILYEEQYEKSYPDDCANLEEYIDNHDNKVIYMFFSDEECVGSIKIRRNWNKYAFIEELGVKTCARGKGIGTALMNQAVAWAKGKGLEGVALETQDNNLLACRFYTKYGFQIGAVDTMLYANFENKDERALFWYLNF